MRGGRGRRVGVWIGISHVAQLGEGRYALSSIPDVLPAEACDGVDEKDDSISRREDLCERSCPQAGMSRDIDDVQRACDRFR